MTRIIVRIASAATTIFLLTIDVAAVKRILATHSTTKPMWQSTRIFPTGHQGWEGRMTTWTSIPSIAPPTLQVAFFNRAIVAIRSASELIEFAFAVFADIPYQGAPVRHELLQLLDGSKFDYCARD